MKILISDSRHVLTLAPQFAGFLQTQNGIDVVRFAHDDIFSDWVGKSLVNRFVNRMAPMIAGRSVNSELIRLVDQVQPDIVWLFKGSQIFPRTLRAIKDRGVLLVNLNADHPWEFAQRGSGTASVANGFHLYDVFFTYSEKIKQDVVQRYPDIAAYVIPFGHNISDSDYAVLSQEKEVNRVCFIGNPDPTRAAFLTELADADLAIDVFGSDWNRYLRPHQNLCLSGQVIGDQYNATLRRYRVQLNMFRPHNANSHNMRTFEVPACGGVMLAPDSDEHRSFFEGGKEAFFYGSVDEAIQRCGELLGFPVESIDAVRQNARKRSVESGYTYPDRAEQAFQIIQQHVS